MATKFNRFVFLVILLCLSLVCQAQKTLAAESTAAAESVELSFNLMNDVSQERVPVVDGIINATGSGNQVAAGFDNQDPSNTGNSLSSVNSSKELPTVQVNDNPFEVSQNQLPSVAVLQTPLILEPTALPVQAVPLQPSFIEQPAAASLLAVPDAPLPVLTSGELLPPPPSVPRLEAPTEQTAAAAPLVPAIVPAVSQSPIVVPAPVPPAVSQTPIVVQAPELLRLAQKTPAPLPPAHQSSLPVDSVVLEFSPETPAFTAETASSNSRAGDNAATPLVSTGSPSVSAQSLSALTPTLPRAVLPSSSRVTSGVDVSSWQDTVDFSALKGSGVEFAYLKATEGKTFVDPAYALNRENSRKSGVISGAYHFFRPATSVNAQVENFLKVVGEVASDDLPPALDLEDKSLWLGYSQKEKVGMVVDWLTQVEQRTGVRPIIYASPSFVEDVLGSAPELAQYKLWIAHYTANAQPDLPKPFSQWLIWQHTDKALLPVVEGKVDVNRFDGDVVKLLADSRSLPPQVASPPTSSVGSPSLLQPPEVAGTSDLAINFNLTPAS